MFDKAGLSPWVRGTHIKRPEHLAGTRFIPVGAGNSTLRRCSAMMSPVYPRGCGELIHLITGLPMQYGLSPWVRGTLRLPDKPTAEDRFIPVGAGNSIQAENGHSLEPVYPRGCGELADRYGLKQHTERFIPVGAGNSFTALR